MESDQEVTREPFEEEDQDDADSAGDSHMTSERQNANLLNDHDTEDVREETSSCDGVEDANYAKSFGIDLRHVRSQSAYERLINSDCFKETSDTKRDDDSKPVIKTSVTSDCIYHKGTFYQKGDIVALCDQDDGQIYFAQIKGFLQDQFCEKSASIHWLIPIKPTSRDLFDPTAYKIGVEDTQLRKLDCMTFVGHCPHDYYLRRFFQNSNLETSHSMEEEHLEPSYKRKGNYQAYIWTSMKPCSVPKIRPDEEPIKCNEPGLA